MRSVLVLLTVVVSITCAPLSAHSQCPENGPGVTVQIRDYAHLKSESLSTATAMVTRAFRNAGIGVQWLGTVQQDADADGKPVASGREGDHSRIAQLTINILSPAMAAKGGVPSNVLGFVAVPPEGGMGRIGYVVYDRVPELAAAVQTSEGEILGAIVGHDIRRLILGNNSPSDDDGVASDHPKRQEGGPLALNFSPSEMAKIRNTLESDAASFPGATVGTSGTADPHHKCVTGGGGVRR